MKKNVRTGQLRKYKTSRAQKSIKTKGMDNAKNITMGIRRLSALYPYRNKTR